MADHRIFSTGLSQVPLGGRAFYPFTVRENGNPEDVTSIRFIVEDHLGATISDETRTTVDISTVATDGGAIEITDISGTGTYEVAYTPPNDGTYTPPTAGLAFTFQVIATDEDGVADTGEFVVTVVGADITITDRSSIVEKIRRRTGIVHDVHHGPQKYPTGSTDIDLGQGPIYELITALRDGIAMVAGTDYTWNAYGSYIVLTSATTGRDEFFFQVQTRVSNDLIFEYIDDAQNRVIYPVLVKFYECADLAASATVDALICAYVVGRIKEEQLVKGATLEDPTYRSGWELVNEVKDIVNSIAAGEQGIVDSTGCEIAKKSGSTVGAFINPRGGVTGRLKLIDEVQRWTGVFTYFHPERDPAEQLDLRNLQ